MKEALIKIKGQAGIDGEELIDFTTVGKAEIENNFITIEYDESQISGSECSVSTIIISEDAVTLNRMGNAVSTMAFVEGQETPADIITPFGNIKLNLFTDKIQLNVISNRIELKLNYNFSLSGERIHNYLTLTCQIQ